MDTDKEVKAAFEALKSKKKGADPVELAKKILGKLPPHSREAKDLQEKVRKLESRVKKLETKIKNEIERNMKKMRDEIAKKKDK